MIKARRNKNIVESIRDEEGNSYEGNKVVDQFVKHFKKFLGESDLVVPIANTYFKRKVSNEEAQCMVKEVSDKEIKEEIFNIDSNKAAGPDGGYSRKNRPKRYAMQVDIQKAYDTFMDILRGEEDYDDLLVLCKGNKGFVEVIKRSMEELSKVSGLAPNLGKIPILDKRLGVRDCKVLIDKVKNKIKCWRNKTLSDDGRIQLLASVLSSIPKEQGGIGIKPLKQWNEVLLIRQFWKIIENKGSLWAKWIRDAVKNHVWYNIGNGKSISVFYDKWCSYGPLSEMISRRSIYDERINDDIVIAYIVNNGKWTWPEEWKSIYPILNSIHDPIIKDSEDMVLWRSQVRTL
ncbi:hypothetical protein Tco_0795768 [Tanacetum coccineum]